MNKCFHAAELVPYGPQPSYTSLYTTAQRHKQGISAEADSANWLLLKTAPIIFRSIFFLLMLDCILVYW